MRAAFNDAAASTRPIAAKQRGRIRPAARHNS